MPNAVLIKWLTEMAELVDAPEGPGGGYIILEAICTIEDLQRRLPAPEPTSR